MLTLVSAISLASTALAVELPDVHIALGEAFPLIAEGSISGEPATKLETALKEPLTSTGVKVKLELNALSSLGAGVLTYTGVKQKMTFCSSEGDAAETILVSGEGHVISKSVAGVLKALLLLLFPPLHITCAKLKITITGPLILSITKVSSGVETTEVGAQSKCVGAGKQEFTEYENDAGELKTKQLLLANLGLGSENACEEYMKEIVVTAFKMATLLF
ncbi:MAG TPA: hypothetical protein VHW67_09725 [Solirubrobacteraceae bacterium]|nr:hypothetical protein [Solirubrobacteraceae bacterium]